jgi:hypothetical protein
MLIILSRPTSTYQLIAEFFIDKSKCRLRIFENRILRRIFGPKRDAKGE